LWRGCLCHLSAVRHCSVLSFCLFDIVVELSLWNCFTTTFLQAICQMIVVALVVNV
jgi:hypothetical protein